MVALIDFDSIIYNSVYKVVSFSEIRNYLTIFSKEEARMCLNKDVYERSIERCENQIENIQNYLSQIFLDEITSTELFITTCSKSFRKELSKDYKLKRKKNKYVWMIREHYKFNDAFFSETLEADDLISIRANELGKDNCIVVSIDKDLKQIGGWYWSYYRSKIKDENNEFVLDENENIQTEYKQKEVLWIDEKQADLFLYTQMLTGDPGDGIKGLTRVGIKTAEKILADSDNLWIKTAREYIKRNQKEDFYINYQLLKLKTK